MAPLTLARETQHNRLAAGEAMLGLEPLEYPIRRVTLLAKDLTIFV